MVNEKVIGTSLLIGSIVICFLYFVWLIIAPLYIGTVRNLFYGWGKIGFFPVPPLYWAIVIPLFLALLLLGIIFGWIGSALIKSPSPPEISAEEIEAELEEAEEAAETESTEG